MIEEKSYRSLSEDGTITDPQRLPSWQDTWESDRRTAGTKRDGELEKPDLFMSVVVPAYNEEKRLGGMLEEAVNYLEHTYGRESAQSTTLGNGTKQRKVDGHTNGHVDLAKGWEILIVSDGSTDKTEETSFAFAREHQLSPTPRGHAGPWSPGTRKGVHIPPGSIRVVTLTKNRGKGGAVTHGMRHVRGQYVVFADADGASKFEDLGKLVSACQAVEDSQGRAVAVGSRAHMVGSEAVVKVCASHHRPVVDHC